MRPYPSNRIGPRKFGTKSNFNKKKFRVKLISKISVSSPSLKSSIFVVTNSKQKNWSKKSQNCLFAVNNCEQKGDNIITLNWKSCCSHLLTANKPFFFFALLMLRHYLPFVRNY